MDWGSHGHFTIIISLKVLFSNSHILRSYWCLVRGMQFIPQELFRSCFEEDFRLSGIWEKSVLDHPTTVFAESRERKLGMRILFVPMVPPILWPQSNCS